MQANAVVEPIWQADAAPSLSVVCIDDNEQVLECCRAIVHSHNYSVQTAARAMDGIEMVRQTNPDLLIVDYQMPDLQGDQVACIAQTFSPDTKVLMLSAAMVPVDSLRYVDAYVPKGEVTSLIAVVEDLLVTGTNPNRP